MRTNLKTASACVLAAGLLTLGAQRSQAATDSTFNYPAFPTTFTLKASWSETNGEIQVARITNKDIKNAINTDWETTDASGEQIVYSWWNDDMWLMNPTTKSLDWDLSSDFILNVDWSVWWSSEKDNSDGSYKYSETGDTYFSFESFGDDWWASSLAFYSDYETPYTYTERGSAPSNNKITYTINENDSFAGYGHDYDDNLNEDAPIDGAVQFLGQGKESAL